MNQTKTVTKIKSHKVIGEWHLWRTIYDDGSTELIEMLSPCDGKDTVKVGDSYGEHYFAVVNSSVFA